MSQRDNMTATCFCGHRMASHKAGGGGCGHCSCDHFTERLVEKCRYCKELLSIRFAPDETVMRLSYNATGLENYAHVECHKKAGQVQKSERTPLGRKKYLPTPLPPSPHPRQAQMMQDPGSVIGAVLSSETLNVLSGILFKLGAFNIDGSVADGDWSDDELSLLAKLSEVV